MPTGQKAVFLTDTITKTDWRIILKVPWLPQFRAQLEVFRETGNIPTSRDMCLSNQRLPVVLAAERFNGYFWRYGLAYRIQHIHPNRGRIPSSGPVRVVRVSIPGQSSTQKMRALVERMVAWVEVSIAARLLGVLQKAPNGSTT